jgi:hypothetical protein
MNNSTGQPYNTQWVLQERPEAIIQAVTNTAAMCDGYTFQPSGPNSVVLTRKYWPVWVIIVAVIGAFLCLIGLLALLYKETETLTVTATEGPDGTKVDVAGTGSTEMVGRLNALLGGLPGAHQTVAAYATPSPTGTVPAPPVPAPVPAPASAPAASASTPVTLDAPANPAAGWYSDPAGHHELRYWSGSAWTEHISDNGTTGTDTLT